MKDSTPPPVRTTRAIRRFQCGKCSGAGEQEQQTSATCTVCDGRGWIEPARGTEQLCPACKGFQKCPVVHRGECAECQGKGYVVALVEITHEEKQRDSPCRRCKGEGVVVQVIEVDLLDCERCGGSGIDFEMAAHGVPMESAKCPDCGGGRKDWGKRREEEDCPACRGKGTRMETYVEEVVRIVSSIPDASNAETQGP
jgi:DnaJ-class molecular chaperone